MSNSYLKMGLDYVRLTVAGPLTALILWESLKQTKCTSVFPLGYTAKTLLPIRLWQREHMLSASTFTIARRQL